MKKQFIAAAVAAAFAAPAMAQVTVYGVIDQAIGSQDDGRAAGAANSASTTTNFTNLLATNRIGLRATEDLGGGLKASFVIEGGLANGGAANWSRATFVELDGPFGKVQLGWADLGTTNIDDAVSQAGNLGAMMTSVDGAAVTNATGNADGLGNDNANGIVYTSPNFSGLTVEVGYKGPHLIATGAASKVKAANTAEAQTGVRIDYRSGPVVFAYGVTNGKSTGNADDRSLKSIGASYNAGFASFGYSQVVAQPNEADEHTFNLFSAAMPMGSGYSIHAAYQTAKANGDDEEASGYTLAATKAFSKRTTGYVAYSSLDNKGANAGYGMRGTGAPAAAGNDPAAWAFGVRHTF